MANAFTKALGTEVAYNAVPPAVYRSLGFPGADDLGNMFQFKADFEDYFCGAGNVGFSPELNPELLSFGEWLEKIKKKLQSGFWKLLENNAYQSTCSFPQLQAFPFYI